MNHFLMEKSDNVFITKSFDPETHFQTSCEDILDVYRRITGKELDITPRTKEGDGKGEQ